MPPQHRHRVREPCSASTASCEQLRTGPCSHAAPEFAQPRQPVRGLVAGDQAGVDRADRGADHPVRLDAGLVQRLVDADLVGAERAAALQHQHDLAEARLARRGDRARLASATCLSMVVLPASRRQCAVQPPSTGSAAPVIEAAASLARNTASAPISSTWRTACSAAARSSTSRITCSRGMPCALAWSSICSSTSGVADVARADRVAGDAAPRRPPARRSWSGRRCRAWPRHRPT